MPSRPRAAEQRLPGEGAEGDDGTQRAAAAAPPRRRATARRCRARPASVRWPAGRSAPPRASGCRSAAARRRRAVLVGCAARPARCSAANSQSPLRSPVKIRPVRLPPCAAGASPTTSNARPLVAPARRSAGPSTARRRTTAASRRRPARATAPAAGRPGRPRRRRRGPASVAAAPASRRTSSGVVRDRRAARRRGRPATRCPAATGPRTALRGGCCSRSMVRRQAAAECSLSWTSGRGVVEERVRRAGVVVDLDVAAGLLDAADRGLDAVGLGGAVLLGGVDHRRLVGVVAPGRRHLLPRQRGVEADGDLDLVVQGAAPERERAAHAEADGADAVAVDLVAAGEVAARRPGCRGRRGPSPSPISSRCASSGSSVCSPWKKSGARATKPALGEAVATSLMWSTRPHHSWTTTTPGPEPEPGIAR